MTRISIHGKGQALDGDLTTTGAVCIASSTHYRGNNQRALRLGDATTECPECKKPGVIVEGMHFFNIEGKPAVVDGALVKCGCPEGINRVVAMGGTWLGGKPLGGTAGKPGGSIRSSRLHFSLESFAIRSKTAACNLQTS
ncbi:PAAR domain-containing protein [Pseudomonas monteilii]|uniref:PAAR domain-containing protein n=1 Tax=Pseudomonas monteilii TaxID=76759 RepID=UPI00267F8577